MIVRTQTLMRMGVGAAIACATIACGSEVPTVATGTAGSSAPGLYPVPSGAAGSAAITSPSTRPAIAGSSALPITATAGSPAAAAGSGALPVTPGTGTEELPCTVSKALKTNCQTCHGTTPIGGAPMPLVTYGDLHKPAITNGALQVYQVSQARLKDQARPMPPGNTIQPSDLTMLDAYLGSGALAATASNPACGAGDVDTVAPGGGTTTGGVTNEYGRLTPLEGETCYDFRVHGGQAVTDTTKYDTGTGEHYEQFYYRAPWPANSVATRYGSDIDNVQVLHHWLLFSTIEFDAEGTHKTSPLPTLNGVNAQLLAGWAVGGTNLTMPSDVGFELPAPGTTINVQWHFYNSTGQKQMDSSSVQICTVPKASRAKTAAITWTGTEDLDGIIWTGGPGMSPHMVHEYGGTCNPLRKGMVGSEPIHIIGFWPHMHQLGINMKATINHAGGMKEVIFDKPFDFNHQIHYMQNYDLAPGDTMTTTCKFNNTTDKGIPFGESTDSEMCYLFTISYPAHALENNASSLIGASNTCW